MSTFEDRTDKVMSFMEAVQQEMQLRDEEDAFKNTVDYKLKALDKCEKDAKDFCYDKFFCQLYKDAVPLSPDYVHTHADDLDTAFRDFMATRCPNGIEWYVKEAIRKGNPVAKRIYEAIDDIVTSAYRPKGLNIENEPTENLVFRSQLAATNDPNKGNSTEQEIFHKLDVMGQDLNTDEISNAVKDNVSKTVVAEIKAAKENKEALKNIEQELAGDINVSTEEAVKDALALRDIGVVQDYIPTLFNGIMINKFNKLQPRYEAGEFRSERLYDAIDMYTENASLEAPSLEELALIETVKEYTALSLLKALKMESFHPKRVNDLALDYATGNIA